MAPTDHQETGVGPAGWLSFRAFAKRVGVSEMAVRKGVKSGRLKACLGLVEGGRQAIVDVPLAEKEWGNTVRKGANPSANPVGSQAPAPAAVASAPAPPSAPAAPADQTSAVVITADTLFEAQKIATLERARKLRLENEVTEGQLVPVSVVAKEAFEAERTIREAILNVPARLSGELAAETDPKRVHARLDAALRECLTSTAAILLETVNA